ISLYCDGAFMVTEMVRHPRLTLAFCLLSFAFGVCVSAQLSPPNAAGVAMGHLHYHVRDVEVNKKFWIALGGQATRLGTTEIVKFPGVLIVITQSPSSGGTNGSVVNHVAFRVQSFAKVEE